MKRIGLIGGMSWQSTHHYYQAINREVEKQLGGLHSADILIHSLDFQPIADLQEQNDWSSAGKILSQSAKQLEMAGADLIAIATNTMHIVAQTVQSAINVPLVHIATPTAKQLIDHGFERVGVLGTKFTLENSFYLDELKNAGLDPLIPDVDITNLNAIIYQELCRGIITDAARQTYVSAIHRLQQRGAEAVILGCTEIAMLINDDHSPIPTYDTTEIHAKELVRLALVD